MVLMSALMPALGFFSKKIRLGVRGRRDWRRRYAAIFQKKNKVAWVHVASLGEFEQGRPVIEALRRESPDMQIVLTFFSPSGFEKRRDYSRADAVFYLPFDTPRNVRDFLGLIQPDLAIFVKYEFWANYLFALRKAGVETLLISAVFRPSQPFFKPWGALWRDMLGCYTQIFVQDAASLALLRSAGVSEARVCVAGDTRADRVMQLPASAPENAQAADFFNRDPGAFRLIVGSSWPPDEALIAALLAADEWRDLRVLIAPHDPSPPYVARLQALLPAPSALYSAGPAPAGTKAYVVDSVGLLNGLYRYAQAAYIGGGFGRGIHNTLEPAAYGLPVLFGPRYHKFEEARQMLRRGGAFCVNNAAELAAALRDLRDSGRLKTASEAVLGYLRENQGATSAIMAYICRRDRHDT